MCACVLEHFMLSSLYLPLKQFPTVASCALLDHSLPLPASQEAGTRALALQAELAASKEAAATAAAAHTAELAAAKQQLQSLQSARESEVAAAKQTAGGLGQRLDAALEELAASQREVVRLMAEHAKALEEVKAEREKVEKERAEKEKAAAAAAAVAAALK